MPKFQHKPIVFLYSEMAGYLIAGLKSLLDKGCEVHVFHWPVNKEAPFVFEQMDGLYYYDRSGFAESALQDKLAIIDPSLIVVSGWMDKGYLKAVKFYKGKIPTIIGLDNQWTGSGKQQIMRMVSPFVLKNVFSHAWVAGEPQAKYARKLGFKNDKLLLGVYTADLSFFNEQYNNNLKAKSQSFPKSFFFVGRYIKHKGIYELWQAFIELQQEQENEWELHCVGTGEEFDNRRKHPKIKHYGFLQPKELSKVIADAGVFVLPSHFEPWGVVVQEFAAAGMPLLLSDKIGAATAFLQNQVNGVSFKAKSVEEIKQAMRSVMRKTDGELLKMSEISHLNADWITPEKWSEKLIHLL